MSITVAQPTTTSIPVQLSENACTTFLLPHLSMPKRGPTCQLGYHRVFNLILSVLYTGMQWKCPDSSWVATRRGLHKPVSSSPPFTPTTTPLVDIIAMPHYAALASPTQYQEAAYVPSLSDRRRRVSHARV